MATLRSKSPVSILVNHARGILQGAGFPVALPITEFALYDSNQKLDKDWLA